MRANVRFPHNRQLGIPAGILEDNILGTALDGSVFAFTILNTDGWRLLKFVENLCKRNNENDSHKKRRRVCIEPRSAGPQDLSVNGDVLSRLLVRHDAARMLLQYLEVEPVDMLVKSAKVDFDTAEERQHRFIALVAAVTELQESADTRQAVNGALLYLERLLDNPL